MKSRNWDTMNRIIQFVDQYRLVHKKSPSTSEIAEGLGIVRSTAYRYLVEMRERGMLHYDGRDIVTPLTNKTEDGVVRAAAVGSVSCGKPLLEEENIEYYVALPEALVGKGEFFLLRANGESMIGAGIADGDTVIVKRQESANNGDIVVALLNDGTTTLKKFFLDKKKSCVRLHPENPVFDDIYVTDLKIQGVAVKVLKDLN